MKRPFLILPTLACILLVSLAADSAETGKDQTLWKQVQQARPTLLNDIETMVNIDSPDRKSVV